MQLRHWQAEAIGAALSKYRQSQPHFLCMATPGAGKTWMASMLARELYYSDQIDLVVCFTPSINTATSFRIALENCLQVKFDGMLGSKGRTLTYQSMLNQSSGFWDLFSQYRILTIFDEIHHCAGDNLENSNAWGQTILHRIQGRAAYTLALTGTPWRSDRIPIALANYCNQGKILCDYNYGLKQAIESGVCRAPQITAIDNELIQFRTDSQQHLYKSFSDLLSHSNCSYQQLLRCDDLIVHVLRLAAKKLEQLRQADISTGALIVASSIEHAFKIAALLNDEIGESATIVTHIHDDAQSHINRFRESKDKWIISVGMISEGTDIPRLKVCCHLTNVKTELYFRQVLGRILRSKSRDREIGYLFMPAEPTLLDFAHRIAEDIPLGNTVNIERMRPISLSNDDGDQDIKHEDHEAHLPNNQGTLSNANPEINLNSAASHNTSPLADAYDSTLDLFGKFRQQIFQLTNP